MLKRNLIVEYLQKLSPAKLALLKFGFILVLTVFLGVVFSTKTLDAQVGSDHPCYQVCLDNGFQHPLCQGCIDSHSDSDIFGRIEPPAGVAEYQAATDGDIGIILFLSTLIRLATIVAGIWTMINFILAGWTYITNPGDASAHEKVSKRMINSVIGLAIVALAYTIAAAIGYIIFGDASYIISPTLTTVDDLQ